MVEYEEDTSWLNIDLSGVRPEVVHGMGHNSEAEIIGRVNTTIDSLIKLSEEHEESLQALVDKQEDEREELLLVLGPQLFSGRRPFEDESGKLKDQRGFGKWIKDNFPNLSEIVNEKEVTAILWAAEFPELRQQMLDKYPRVKTTRGAYAKWKEESKDEEVPFDTSGTGSNSRNTSNSGSPSKGSSSSSASSSSSNNTGNSNGSNISTSNPDQTIAQADVGLIASSLIGVVTNMQIFESLAKRSVGERELASAIFQEIKKGSADVMTDAEVEEYIETKLKYTLGVIVKALPELRGIEENVIDLTKAMEKYQ